MGVQPGTEGGRRMLVAVSTAPVSLRAAGALVATEGLVMFGLGVLQFVRGFGGDIGDPWRAELGAAMALAFGVTACLVARALVLHRPWARSPIIVVQLLCLPVAVGLLQGGMYGYGVPLLVVPIAVLVLLGVSGAYRSPESSRTPRGSGGS